MLAAMTRAELQRALSRRQQEDTEGLLEAVMERFPADRSSNDLKAHQAFRASVEAVIRGDPSYLALPSDVPCRWVDMPKTVPQSNLSKIAIKGLRLAMTVEDHIPGYGDTYSRLFPVEEVEDPVVLWANRQVRFFTSQWVYQESGHALRLFIYLLLSGKVDPVELTAMMTREAKKLYAPPSLHAAGLFTYAMIQERATQIYYGMFRQQVDEPVLQANLSVLNLEEAQHGKTFANFLEPILQSLSHAAYEAITEALLNFRMPLSDMIENYQRQAAALSLSAGRYNYVEGFKAFRSLLTRVTNASPKSRDHPLDQLLEFTKTLPTAQTT